MRRALCMLAGWVLLCSAAVPARAGGCGNGSTSRYVCGPDSYLVARDGHGRLRDFEVYLPVALPTLRPVPLLVVLHGLANYPSDVETASGIDRLADAQGIAVAYPHALHGSWNAGTCCGPSADAGEDDVGFLTQVVSTLAALRPLDLRRVYVAGFSNGGMLALRAVCERPEVFAAAAAVAATLESRCEGSQPVSALLVNGAADRTVPYAGSRYSSYLRTALTPVPGAVRTLADRSGCQHSVGDAGTVYRGLTYLGCRDGTSVRLVTLPRTDHHWPVTEHDGVDATDLVWHFLEQQVRPYAS